MGVRAAAEPRDRGPHVFIFHGEIGDIGQRTVVEVTLSKRSTAIPRLARPHARSLNTLLRPIVASRSTGPEPVSRTTPVLARPGPQAQGPRCRQRHAVDRDRVLGEAGRVHVGRRLPGVHRPGRLRRRELQTFQAARPVDRHDHGECATFTRHGNLHDRLVRAGPTGEGYLSTAGHSAIWSAKSTLMAQAGSGPAQIAHAMLMRGQAQDATAGLTLDT
jgi:hypothetical protein